MSRSYRKNVFSSHCGTDGMKEWRTQENRRLRHNTKQLINNCEDYDNLIIPVLNDFGGMWDSPQDGKKFYYPKPLLNQCQCDDMKYGIRWGHRHNSSQLKNGHYPQCRCYNNKSSWYWKLKRK